MPFNVCRIRRCRKLISLTSSNFFAYAPSLCILVLDKKLKDISGVRLDN